jgi:Terminase large subunit, T4likevirus-type, N-terminal
VASVITWARWLEVFKGDRGNMLVPLSWWGDVLAALQTHKVVVVSLARQRGKTSFALAYAGYHLVTIPHALVLFVAGSEGQGQELFGRKCRPQLVAALKEIGVDLRKCVFTKRSVQLPNGARLEVLAPSEISSVGRTATLVIEDEAKFIPDPVHAAILPSLITTHGALLIISSAPRPEDGGFFLGLLNDPPPEAQVIRVMGDNDNPQADPGQLGVIGRLLARLSQAYYRREILNEIVPDDVRSLFPLPLIERAIDPALGELPGSDAPAFAGLDLARRKDDANLLVVVREPGRRPESRDHLRVAAITTWSPKASPTGEVPFEEVRAALGALPKRFPRLERVLIDEGAEGGAVLPFARSHPALSLRVQGFQATVDSNMTLWSGLAARLHAGTLSLPRHQRLIDELVNLRQEEIQLGAKWRVTDASKRFHRDLSVALALACLAAGEAGPEPAACFAPPTHEMTQSAHATPRPMGGAEGVAGALSFWRSQGSERPRTGFWR